MSDASIAAVDVVIPDLDGGSLLKSCLDSVFEMEMQPSRVIIVDNGSRIPVSSRLEKHAARVEVIRIEENLGFARGVNRGVRATNAPLVALINNDVELSPEWLGSMVEVMESNTAIATCQSVILDRDGRVDGAGVDLSDGTIRQLGHGRRPESVHANEAAGASATAALYRRAAVEEVTGGEWMLEELGTWYEDVELALLLRERGWNHVTLPRPLATHWGSASAHEIGELERTRMKTRNRYLVARLHPRFLSLLPLVREDLGLLARAIFRLDLRRAAAILSGMIAGTTGALPRRRER